MKMAPGDGLNGLFISFILRQWTNYVISRLMKQIFTLYCVVLENHFLEKDETTPGKPGLWCPFLDKDKGKLCTCLFLD